MDGAIDLGLWDVALAAGFVLLAGLVSAGLRLGIGKRLGVAALRTVAQLLLIGYVLEVVFRAKAAWMVGLVVLVMLAVAARAAVRRPSRSVRGVYGLAFVSLVASGLVTSYCVTGLVIGAEPWWTPQYLIPLLGMILGNSLTGISLCLDDLLATFQEKRARVEMELAHGASRWEAARGGLQDAVRRGMIPIINSMMVVGLVSLPGMMTGQILAGEDPANAVRYQVVVMFMLAAATALGSVGVALLTYRRLFNTRHQLLAGSIRQQES
jgi:putative ABC transport system permease protein